MSKQSTIKRFKTFISNIKPTDRVAVIHHTDCDGMCSGFIVAEALARLGTEPALVQSLSARAMNSSFARKLKHNNITKTITVDLGLDQVPKVIEQISDFSDVLIIDHHKLYNDVQTEHVTTIKHTHLGIKNYYPASKLAYDLFSEITDIKDMDWVAAVGLVGDSGFPGNKRFVHGVMKKYNIFPAAELFETDIGKAANYINSANAVVPTRAKLAFRILKKAKSPQDILESELASLVEEVKAEKNKQIALFKKNVETHGDLMIHIIDSKYRIKSAVITALSFGNYQDKTLIIMQESGGFYNISARRQDRKLAVNDLLERATKGLEQAGGGGHAPAAGGSIMVKDLDKFKEQLIRVHEEMTR